MVLSAASAITLTSNAVRVHEAQALTTEVGRAESAIQNAASRELYLIHYNATLVGNPPMDVDEDSSLTDLQIEFRDAFVDAGYLVSRDEDGFWLIRWAEQGAPSLVQVYSVRTTVTPGPVLNQTLDKINVFFEQLLPKTPHVVKFINLGTGGDISEGDFGASASTFYEYLAIVQQSEPDTDHKAGLLSALTTAGLGYTGANTEVYKLV